MQRKESWRAWFFYRKRGGNLMWKSIYFWVRGLSSIFERWDLLSTFIHPVVQSGVLTKNGLLKSGSIVMEVRTERFVDEQSPGLVSSRWTSWVRWETWQRWSQNMCHEEFSTNWQEWCVIHSPLKKLQSFRITRALSRVIGTRNTQRWKQCQFSIMETMKNWSMIFTALRTERFISWQPFWGGVLRCRCRDNDIIPTTMTCWVMWRLSGRQCGDDTHKSRSLIQFLHEWYLSRLSLPVRWRMPSASLRCCFSLVPRHAWCSESVRVDCCAWCAVPFVGARDSSVRCV